MAQICWAVESQNIVLCSSNHVLTRIVVGGTDSPHDPLSFKHKESKGGYGGPQLTPQQFINLHYFVLCPWSRIVIRLKFDFRFNMMILKIRQFLLELKNDFFLFIFFLKVNHLIMQSNFQK